MKLIQLTALTHQLKCEGSHSLTAVLDKLSARQAKLGLFGPDGMNLDYNNISFLKTLGGSACTVT